MIVNKLQKLTLIIMAAFMPWGAIAQGVSWPNKPIKIVVPFATGSFTDTATRLIGSELSNRLGQPVIVENKTGAGGTLGVDFVAKSVPDGYTFLLMDNSFSSSAALYEKLPYQSNKDLLQVSLIAESAAVLVGRPNLTYKTTREVVEYARRNPGVLTYATAGVGSSAHLVMEAFLTQNNIKMTPVPYKGIVVALIDVVADRVDLVMGGIGSLGAHVKDGRLNGIAVSGPQRSSLIPSVPTFTESGFPNDKMLRWWWGIMAPVGTSKNILDRMQNEISIVVKSSKVQDAFISAGARPVSNTSTEFSSLVRDETALWVDVIKSANIKASLY